MTIDVEGMLHNAADCIPARRDEGGYRHALPELAKNLRELRDRWMAGDSAVIQEFFTLYTFTDGESEAPCG